MSEAAIEQLNLAEQRLRGAMEGADPKAIEEALAAFTEALEPVRALGAWRADPALKERLQNLRKRMQSDQGLARLLADISQQKLDHLAGVTAQPVGRTTYTRKG